VARLKLLVQPLRASGVFAVLLGPGRPRSPKFYPRLEGARLGLATLINPGQHRVLGFEIRVRRFRHDFWRSQADALPFKATVNHPLQDAGPFWLKLLGKLAISFFRRNSDGERNQVEAAPDCLINGA